MVQILNLIGVFISNVILILCRRNS